MILFSHDLALAVAAKSYQEWESLMTKNPNDRDEDVLMGHIMKQLVSMASALVLCNTKVPSDASTRHLARRSAHIDALRAPQLVE